MRITEETIIRAHDKLVKEAASKARGLERDEAEAVARIGLLLAIRTWTAGMCSFESYARQRIDQQIVDYKRRMNNQRRAEAMLSLDAHVGAGERATTFGDLVAIVEADQTMVDVALFIRDLEPAARMFVRLRLQGYDNKEIARMMNYEEKGIARLHERVKGIMCYYFELGGESA